MGQSFPFQDSLGVFKPEEKEGLSRLFSRAPVPSCWQLPSDTRSTDYQPSDRDRKTVASATEADLIIGDTVYKITDIEHWSDAIKKTHNTKHKWTRMYNHQIEKALSCLLYTSPSPRDS